MAGKASKIKGKAWERSICAFLSETLGGSFIRTPGSGAFVGGKNSSRKEFLSDGQIKIAKADIIPPDHLPHLVIEAKNYANFPFHQLWSGSGCKLLDAWIDQTETSADPDDVWFTIFKIDRKGSWIVFDRKHESEFKYATYMMYRLISPTKVNDYIITDMKDFININADKVIKLCGPKEKMSHPATTDTTEK